MWDFQVMLTRIIFPNYTRVTPKVKPLLSYQKNIGDMAEEDVPFFQ